MKPNPTALAVSLLAGTLLLNAQAASAQANPPPATATRPAKNQDRLRDERGQHDEVGRDHVRRHVSKDDSGVQGGLGFDHSANFSLFAGGE
jgi:hypothetical protein